MNNDDVQEALSMVITEYKTVNVTLILLITYIICDNNTTDLFACFVGYEKALD